MLSLPRFLALQAFCSLSVSAFHRNIAPRPAAPTVDAPEIPVTSRNGTQLPPYNTIYTFDQLKDHNDPSKGTFTQRYYFTYEWYQAGGPITFFTPGEIAFDNYTGYLTNKTVVGTLAQAANGASVVLEHRFYGLSNPGPDLSATSLALHTLDQAVADLVYFAQNAKLPMPGGDQVKPTQAPWILMGGSYSGALTAWTMQHRPGIFWAGYASSAVVEAINYFWGYFEPIRQWMPQNCSADVEAVITHVDQVLSNGTASQKSDVKNLFGIGDVDHDDDAAGALRNNLWDWQSLAPDVGPGSQFFNFCDALEVKDGVSAPAQGWGLDHALNAWGDYWKTTYLGVLCGTESPNQCLGTYNLSQSQWSDVSLNQDFRSWMWIVCNQVGYLQDGAPIGWPSLVTRLVTPIYDERQCVQMWPDHFKSPPVPRTAQTNSEFDGWDLNVNRLFIANGNRDPWRESTTSSDYHPRQSTSEQVIYVSNGFHCSDLNIPNNVDPTVKAVQGLGVAYLGKWIQEWRQAHPGVPSISNFSTPDPNTLPKPPVFKPTPIPQRIINAPPPPLPPSLNPSTPSTPSQHGTAPRAAVIPNAWAKSFGSSH